ncbi:MAG: hypothetical protein ACR2RB_06250 [Gammaproteobacteria bacterium]
MKALVEKLLGMGSRLSALEALVLDAVRHLLAPSIAGVWDKQVRSINKVQRLPEGVEVNFYRMTAGKPSFDDALAFANRTEELKVATVQIQVPAVQDTLTASVWCVNGFLFSIEYRGNVKYFEEAAGMDPKPAIQIDCKIEADLSTGA